jgi:hypothetical protein
MRGILLWVLQSAHRKAIDARRAGRSGAYVAYALLSGVTTAIGLAIGLAMFLGLWYAGIEPVAIVLGVIVVVPFAGPAIVRHVLAPRGWVRLAHTTGFGSIASGKDPDAYALVTAAWAHLRRPSAAGEAWVEARRGKRGMTGDAEIVAAGLLALARGDTSGGRALLASASDLEERHVAVRELAAEALAAIDVEAGDFAAILARATTPAAWPASPLTFLIEGCAQRITGDPAAPTASALWTRWALAPRRRQTRALVLRALAADPRRRPSDPSPAAVSPSEPAASDGATAAWPAAVTAHVAALRARKPDRATLGAAARAWDTALGDAETRLWLYQRAAELAAPADTGESVTRTLRAQVAADLAELAELAQLATVDDGSAIATEIARQARGHRLATLELAFAAWEDRARARTELPPIDEWRAFLSLRASYDQAAAAGGLELRRLAFPHALVAGGVVSAWLWNQRKEYVLSHAISAWLLAEAKAVGDANAIEHEAANTRLRVPVRSE